MLYALQLREVESGFLSFRVEGHAVVKKEISLCLAHSSFELVY